MQGVSRERRFHRECFVYSYSIMISLRTTQQLFRPSRFVRPCYLQVLFADYVRSGFLRLRERGGLGLLIGQGAFFDRFSNEFRVHRFGLVIAGFCLRGVDHRESIVEFWVREERGLFCHPIHSIFIYVMCPVIVLSSTYVIFLRVCDMDRRAWLC